MVQDLIEKAYSELWSTPGFGKREAQHQLSLLIADLMQGGQSGAFEAPTGLGKSLAMLLPAIAYAVTENKRVVISTYTNVLAEQYWNKDVPLALGLFNLPNPPKVQLLEGHARYACRIALATNAPDLLSKLGKVKQGLEPEIRKAGRVRLPWSSLSAPDPCPGRYCPEYNRCYYYNARTAAQKASIIITNHSMMLTDAMAASESDGEAGPLGAYDYLIIDEAADLAGAAQSTFEFELYSGRIDAIETTVTRLAEQHLQANPQGEAMAALHEALSNFQQVFARVKAMWNAYSALARPGILFASPQEVFEHPAVKRATLDGLQEKTLKMTTVFADGINAYLAGVAQVEDKLEAQGVERLGQLRDTTRGYKLQLRQVAGGLRRVGNLDGVSTSYLYLRGNEFNLRTDIVDVAPILKEVLWDRVPAAAVSATLAVDGHLQGFKETTGMETHHEEILPSPFDFATQAAVYLPPPDTIPDPSQARKQQNEELYFYTVAEQVTDIITAMQGRTLVLFSSRREMEAVYERMHLPEDLPLYFQARTGSGSIADKFRSEKRSSLFALRSFWTGFDAPGETLSCTVIVRVPFEVPIAPPAMVRAANLVAQGRDPFAEYTLSQAKTMMRQGVGRLIRTTSDKGIIVLLDPRLRTKNYGQAILDNLPSEMKVFSDIYESISAVSLLCE